MSDRNPIEITGNLIVHHPIKDVAPVYQEWFDAEVAKVAQRFKQRGEAITFYREVEERRAA